MWCRMDGNGDKRDDDDHVLILRLAVRSTKYRNEHILAKWSAGIIRGAVKSFVGRFGDE